MSSIDKILALWSRVHQLPGGRIVFSKVVGQMIPYTGSVKPHILEISQGRSVVLMQDRRRLRNHLNSIHALALANLGELASGLAFFSSLPPGYQGIVKNLHIEYLKKARGPIWAYGRCDFEASELPVVEVEAELKNEQDETVAILKAQWSARKI